MGAFGERSQIAALEIGFPIAFNRVHVISQTTYSRLLYIHPSVLPISLLVVSFTYLCGRRLQVRLRSALSIKFVSTSGVFQGSHLGPTLFKLYFNYIVTGLYSATLLFPNGMMLHKTVTNVRDALALQKDFT